MKRSSARVALGAVVIVVATVAGGRAHGQNVACCMPGDSCAELPLILCDALGGVALEEGAVCSEVACFGACCFADGSCFDGVSVLTCDGEWLGSASTCTACAAPGGACCLSSGQCLDAQDESSCAALNGTFLGEGTTCAATPCGPVGACCVFETGDCIDGVSQFDCESGRFGTGDFQGDGTTCADSSCPIFGFGACCFPGFCIDAFDEGDCLGGGGTYQGDNTSCSLCCPWDVDEDQLVGVTDLVAVILDWGSDDPAADVTGDGAVNVDDLVQVILNWGPCPI